MVFKCTICNYRTDDKSNINRHYKTKKHIENTTNKKDDENLSFICNECGKEYMYASGLSKHLKSGRCGTDVIKHLEEEYNKKLKAKELEIENQYLKRENTELKQFLQNKDSGSTTYNISIKNFIQQYYPDAPALEPIENYNLLEHKESTELMDTLIHKQTNGQLSEYLGDFLVKCYKKEDPTQQSIWNSDTARLTYIIKDLLASNDSCWNQDFKGVKTTNFIIKPLLQYLNTYVKDHIIKESNIFASLKGVKMYWHIDRIRTLSNIQKEIENGVLGGKILKYIAPYFYLKNRSIEGSDKQNDEQKLLEIE